MSIDLKDPNNKLYVVCTRISVAIMMSVSVISLAYLVAAAPGEAYILTNGDDSLGVTYPLICAAVFVICLALLIKDLSKRMSGCPDDEKDARFMRAPVSKAGMLFSITAFTSVAVILLSDLIGESITEDFLSGMTDYELMICMMCAGPEEEFLCRMLLIGLPVALVCMLKGHPRCAKNMLGGFRMSRTALAFLILSSVVFGLMHLDGWSIMKFPDTFISGMLFGYVYIQYGVHATIVMHSSFDLISCFDVFFDWAGTIPLMVMCVLGAVLAARSLFKMRSYVPKNSLNEPFEGSLMEMWERD